MSTSIQSAGASAAATSGAVANESPASAMLLRLPNSGAPAVCQARRAGRLPKAVLPLWRARMRRDAAVQVFALQAQVSVVTEQMIACTKNSLRIDRAMVSLKAEDEHNRALWDALAAQLDDLKSRLADLATTGVAK